MKAKAMTRCCGCVVFAFLLAANGSKVEPHGIKVDTLADGFLPRSDHGAGRPLHMLPHVASRVSLLDVSGFIWSSVKSHVSKPDTDAAGVTGKTGRPDDNPAKLLVANSTDELTVPANRQQMYFRPVSVTLKCVMMITIASLLVYTTLSASRNYDELSATFTPSTFTQTLTVALRVANIAPMLCMLFVACRMYVLATTEGLGEPPAWVKTCMYTACIGMFIQFLVVVALPVFSKTSGAEEAAYDFTEGQLAKSPAAQSKYGKSEDELARDSERNKLQVLQKKQTVTSRRDLGIVDDGKGDEPPNLVEVTGQYTDVHPVLSELEYKESVSFMKYVFWGFQNLGILLLYGSVAGVIVGIYTFPVGSTKISAAVLCTVAMSKLYFLVFLLLWIARAMPESDFQYSCKNAALAMTMAVRKFPMFAVLFLAARMRALNLDPPVGMPPFWMQCCFYGITGLVCLETLGAALVGFTGEMRKAYYGVYIFNNEDSPWLHWLERLPGMIALVVVIPVIHGVYLMEDSSGNPAPLSTTLHCLVWFQAIYCLVEFLKHMILLSEHMGSNRPIMRDTAISAGISLNIAPLLCILFVATRMRALQITQQRGAPPGWAQDCMLVALFATCVQALCCLVMPIFVGDAVQVDDDGNPDYDLEPMIGAYAVTVVKYVALMALHGSVIVICFAVFEMTPENAHAGGRFLTNPKQFFKACLVTMCVFFLALMLSSAKVVGMAIKTAIESCDQPLLGVDITIKKCALNLLKGYVHISRLVVHQPEQELVYAKGEDGKLVATPTGKPCEWKEDFISKIHLVLVKINLWRLITSRGKEFELQNLSLQGVYLNIEKPNTDTKAKNSNVEYILNHIEALGLLGSKGGDDEAAKPEPKKKVFDLKYEVKKPGPAQWGMGFIEVGRDFEAVAKIEGNGWKNFAVTPSLPPKLTINEANGTISGRPEKGDVNEVEYTITASKDDKSTASGKFKIKVGSEFKPKASTRIILHKISFGDMGVGVTISNVKFLGEISFAPSIGLLQFDDIQKEVFGGREDLEPGQTVALLIKAIVAKIFKEVAHQIPRKIMESVGMPTGIASRGLAGVRESLAKSWHRFKGYHED